MPSNMRFPVTGVDGKRDRAALHRRRSDAAYLIAVAHLFALLTDTAVAGVG